VLPNPSSSALYPVTHRLSFVCVKDSAALRLGAVALLLALELIGASVFLDTEALGGRGGLTAALGDWAPWILRGATVFAATYLVLGWMRCGTLALNSLRHSRQAPIRKDLLAAHAVVFATAAALAAIVFGTAWSGPGIDGLAAASLLAGVASTALLVLAVIPAQACRGFLEGAGNAWAYALVVAIAACLLGSAAAGLWQGWIDLTFRAVQFVLRPLIPSIAADPVERTIDAGGFGVTVAPGCSGIEGVTLMFAFGSAWLLCCRREFRFPRALVLVPIGMALMWVLNVARIAALVLIGVAGAPGIAQGGFHSQAGWIGFTTVALGLSWFARRVPWALAETPEGVVKARLQDNPAAPYLLPMMAVLGAAMVSRAVSDSGVELLYPLRLAAGGAALFYCRRTYSKLNWNVGLLAPLLGAVVFAIWMGLEPARTGDSGVALQSGLQALPAVPRFLWLLCRTVGSVAIVPIVEELAFRGFLIDRLTQDFSRLGARASVGVAVAISALAFGFLHQGRWMAGVAAGLIYALCYLRRGRIGDAIVAHAATNALIACSVLGGGQWNLW
jgi:exosortase E/protease (VPEID-CTERM system)